MLSAGGTKKSKDTKHHVVVCRLRGTCSLSYDLPVSKAARCGVRLQGVSKAWRNLACRALLLHKTPWPHVPLHEHRDLGKASVECTFF